MCKYSHWGLPWFPKVHLNAIVKLIYECDCYVKVHKTGSKAADISKHTDDNKASHFLHQGRGATLADLLDTVIGST